MVQSAPLTAQILCVQKRQANMVQNNFEKRDWLEITPKLTVKKYSVADLEEIKNRKKAETRMTRKYAGKILLILLIR